MAGNLFREEALRLGMAAEFGDAVFHQPLSLKAMVLSLIVLFGAFLLFATLMQIRTTVPVPGHLSPVSGEVQVYAERSGIVRELLVVDGDEVARGQTLAIVEAPLYDRSGASANQARLQQLEEQMNDLQERRQTRQQRVHLDQEAEREHTQALRVELDLLQEQQQTLNNRLALTQQSFDRQQLLHARGLVADAELEKQHDALLGAVQASQSQQFRIATQHAELEASQRRLQRLPLQAQEELLALSAQLSQLKSHKGELQQQSIFSVSAPASGVVSNQVLVVGDQVDARVPFLSLVAVDAVLEVYLYVPSRALGELALGQEVMVELDAYPSQLHGTWSAEVSAISAVAMNPREFVFPLEVQEPIYLVRARLLGGPIDATLRSGMQLRAEIVTGRETLLQKMTAPLRSVGRRL